MSEQDDSGEVGLFFRPRPRLGAMDPFRPHFGEKEIVVASVKAWCPEDGGHEFESEDLHVFSHFESAYIEVRCPIHGWKDATI